MWLSSNSSKRYFYILLGFLFSSFMLFGLVNLFIQKRFFLPPNVIVRYISDPVLGKSNGLAVYVIEDLHNNKSCQNEIYSIVKVLSRYYDRVNILMEGAPGGKISIELYDFLKSKDKNSFDKLVESLLNQGQIDSRSAIALSGLGDEKFNLYGMEDDLFYRSEWRFYQALGKLLPNALLKMISLSRRELLWYLFYPFDSVYSCLYRFTFLRESVFSSYFSRILDSLSSVDVHSSNTSKGLGISRRVSNECIVVICGGFHTDMFVKLLDEANVPFVVLVPDILVSPSRIASPSIFWGETFRDRWFSVWKRFCSALINEPISSSFQNIVFPMRFPSFLWNDIRRKLISYDRQLYYLVRGRGFAWTDILGNVHFLDEFLASYYGDDSVAISAMVWAIFADAIRKMYREGDEVDSMLDSFQLLKKIIIFHEKLHVIFRRHPDFKKKVLLFVRRQLKDRVGRYVEWIQNVYGMPPGIHNLSVRQIEDWSLEEWVVELVQEYVFRGDGWEDKYLDLLRRNGVRLPDSVDNLREFFRMVIFYVMQPESPVISVLDNKSNMLYKEQISGSIRIRSSKLKKLWLLLLRRYRGKSLPYLGISISDLSKLVYLQIASNMPKNLLLKTAALVQFIEDSKEIDSMLQRCGYSTKQVKDIITVVSIVRNMHFFPFLLGKDYSLAYEYCLQDINDFFMQLSNGNYFARKLYLYDFLVLESLLGYGEDFLPWWCDSNKAGFLCLPFAERLGEKELFLHLKDFLMQRLYPVDYFSSVGRLKELLGGYTEESLINEIYAKIYSVIPELHEEGYLLYGRLKSIGSLIEKKARRNVVDFKKLRDLIGIMLVVHTEREAERITHILKDKVDILNEVECKKVSSQDGVFRYYVLSGRFMGLGVEVQVRSKDVHQVLEEKDKAHWFYNLKKLVPNYWRDQKYSKTRNRLENPVFFFLFKLSASKLEYFKKSGLLDTAVSILPIKSGKKRKKKKEECIIVSFVRASRLNEILEIGEKEHWIIYGYNVSDVFSYSGRFLENKLSLDIKYLGVKKAREKLLSCPQKIYMVSNSGEFSLINVANTLLGVKEGKVKVGK